MGYFNDKLSDALKSGEYVCSQCGALMEFENENEDILVCAKCGHSVFLDDYGSEYDGDYDSLFYRDRTGEMEIEEDFEYDND